MRGVVDDVTVVGLAALLLLLATPAAAFVRTRTSTGTPLEWRRGCPSFELDLVDGPGIPVERLRAALEASAAAWRDGLTCGGMGLTIAPGTVDGHDVAFDGASVVLWRQAGFCDDPSNDDQVCLAPNAAAVTTVFYYDRPGEAIDGELIEADLELNGVGYDWSDDGDPARIDLQNTLSHELGHALGLDHTCYTIPGARPPVDDTGRDIPYCFPVTALDDSVTSATMFNFEDPGEISKRTPRADELAAVCEIYRSHPSVCRGAPVGCQCRAASGPVGGWRPEASGALGLALLLLRHLLRKRGRS